MDCLKKMIKGVRFLKNRPYQFKDKCIVFSFTALLLFGLYFMVTSTAKLGRSREHQKVYHRPYTLCVIVPFRERFEELLEFVPHISLFLIKQNIEHRIFIINQVDGYRFNRGSLVNVGFLYATFNYSSHCDYVAIHDVDLLPLSEWLSYEHPGNAVFHVSSPQLHPNYHYKTFIGGILLITVDDFKKVNGMSNKYWGWGLEDDEFYLRLKEADIKINSPRIEDVKEPLNKSFKHIHPKTRKRDMEKCFNQKEATRKRDRVTGLHSVKYVIRTTYNLTVNSFPIVIINVALNCDRNFTPWCLCSNPENG